MPRISPRFGPKLNSSSFQRASQVTRVAGLIVVTGLAVGCTISAEPASKSSDGSGAPAAIQYGPAPEPYSQIVSGSDRKLDMVGVPGGSITVSDPEDPTKTIDVEIKPFWIAKYEIVWEFYDPFVFEDMEAEHETPQDADAFARPSKPYIPPDLDYGHEGYPVISASFQGAEEFCKWLSFRTGKSYRVPTEAEWEWACRAGSTGAYSFGDDVAALGDYAWFDGNSDIVTHPVGEKLPNDWGLYDMHGNSGEWTTDMAGRPVIRGGSQQHTAEQAAASARLYQTSKWNETDPQIPKSPWWLSDCPFGGFRVICVPE